MSTGREVGEREGGMGSGELHKPGFVFGALATLLLCFSLLTTRLSALTKYFITTN